MAWLNGKRTVYCRYCGGRGHNKRNCPQMTPEQKARIPRKACRYCMQSGHNKTTCPDRKADMAKFEVDNAAYRAAALERMRSMGIAEGALMAACWGYDKSKFPKGLENGQLVMVKCIDWDKCNAKTKNIDSQWQYPLVVRAVEDGTYDDYVPLPLGSATDMPTESRQYYEYLLVSPVDASDLTPPEGWLTAKGTAKQFF